SSTKLETPFSPRALAVKCGARNRTAGRQGPARRQVILAFAWASSYHFCFGNRRGGDHEEDIPAQQQPAKEDARVSSAHVDQRGPAGSETSSGERAKEADREWLKKPTKDFLKDIEYLDLRTTREFTIAAGRCIREVSSSSGWRIVWSI